MTKDTELATALRDPNWAFDYLTHVPNKEVLGSHDNMEAFTPPDRKTPQEIVGHDAYAALKAAGFTIVQVVQTGNKPLDYSKFYYGS